MLSRSFRNAEGRDGGFDSIWNVANAVTNTIKANVEETTNELLRTVKVRALRTRVTALDLNAL